MRRLTAAIRDNDERKTEKAVLQLAGTRKISAPPALAVGAFVVLFSGLRLPVTNWRLIPVQMLPARWIWAVTVDPKTHALTGRQFHDIRGPVALVPLAAMVLITSTRLPSPSHRPGSRPAGRHRPGARAPQDGHRLGHGHRPGTGPGGGNWSWFALLPAIVLATMMVCYVAVAARIVGMRTARPAGTAQSGRVAKMAGAAVTGVFGAIVCTLHAIARVGIYLLGSSGPMARPRGLGRGFPWILARIG